jgi:ATP:corrinoid adenosyltransferase
MMIGKTMCKWEQIRYDLGIWNLCKEFIKVSAYKLFLDEVFALLKSHWLSTDHLDMIIEANDDSLNIILFLSEIGQCLVKYASQLTLMLSSINILLLL